MKKAFLFTLLAGVVLATTVAQPPKNTSIAKDTQPADGSKNAAQSYEKNKAGAPKTAVDTNAQKKLQKSQKK